MNVSDNAFGWRGVGGNVELCFHVKVFRPYVKMNWIQDLYGK